MQRVQDGANVIYLHTASTEGAEEAQLGRMVAEIATMTRQKTMSARIANNNAPQTLTTHELASIRALIAYVAFHTHDRSTEVAQNLGQRFHVADITQLHPDHFEEAIRYLVDLGTEGAQAE